MGGFQGGRGGGGGGEENEGWGGEMRISLLNLTFLPVQRSTLLLLRAPFARLGRSLGAESATSDTPSDLGKR